jgi:hypothetical protein
MAQSDLEVNKAESKNNENESGKGNKVVEFPAIFVRDFISDYANYADVIEAPREAHEIVALSIIAAALNLKVSIKNGEQKLPMDFWTLILSRSGYGRNTLLGLAKPIENASQTHIIRNVLWGSKEGMQEDIASESRGLYVWPEFSSVFKPMLGGRYIGAKEWITNLYDNYDVPETTVYRTSGRDKTTPIEFDEPPRLNFLASSSTDWFVSSLTQEDTTGGFIPRWTILNLRETGKLIPEPKLTDRRWVKPLGMYLRQVATLKGHAELSKEARELYHEWYRESFKRFSDQQHTNLAMPYWNRMRGQILKAALAYEVSSSLKLLISPESFNRAEKLMKKVEETIFGLLPTGMNKEGFEVDKIEQKIKTAGDEGIARSTVTRAFQSMEKKNREDRIETLKDSHTIQEFIRASTGRPASYLVHKDSVDAYLKKYPVKKQTSSGKTIVNG